MKKYAKGFIADCVSNGMGSRRTIYEYMQMSEIDKELLIYIKKVNLQKKNCLIISRSPKKEQWKLIASLKIAQELDYKRILIDFVNTKKPIKNNIEYFDIKAPIQIEINWKLRTITVMESAPSAQKQAGNL